MSEDLVLRNGLLVDGTGAEPTRADVIVRGGKIVDIRPPGDPDASSGIDLSGHVVCPGFVDIHSHADYTLLHDGRAHSSTLQGVTSLVIGNCGHGIAPLSVEYKDMAPMNIFGWAKQGELAPSWRSFGDYLDLMRDRGVAPNVYPLVAHGALRVSVAGLSDRRLERNEIARLRRELDDAMAAGAVGMSTGLEYVPGISAPTEELLEIARGLQGYDGLYATHCRNRSDSMDTAAAEAVAIAQAGNARLQMSHFIKRPHGDSTKSDAAWDILRRARADGTAVYADVFPFNYGPTPLGVLIPARLRSGGRAEMAGKLRTPSFRQQVLAGMGGMFDAAVRNGLVNSMFVAADGGDGTLSGKSLAEVASMTGQSAVEAAYWLLEQAGEDFYCVTIIEEWVVWQDLLNALKNPDFFIMGDGATGVQDKAGFVMAPSDWGYAPRFLGQFVRENGEVPLSDAIHRMTMGPARHLGLTDRGTIEIGQAADIVAFRYHAIGSDVSPSNLKIPPTGIDYVWINGQKVVEFGQPIDVLAGEVGIRR